MLFRTYVTGSREGSCPAAHRPASRPGPLARVGQVPQVPLQQVPQQQQFAQQAQFQQQYEPQPVYQKTFVASPVKNDLQGVTQKSSGWVAWCWPPSGRTPSPAAPSSTDLERPGAPLEPSTRSPTPFTAEAAVRDQSLGRSLCALNPTPHFF